jgi:hypothetical protein
MQQLQQLDLATDHHVVPAAVVAQLFSATPRLTALALGGTITQEAFDALLAHATQLTRLTCWNLFLSESRSQSACSWKELVVTGAYGEGCYVLRTLEYLPLRSLSRVSLVGPLEWFGIPDACPHLQCWLTTGDHSPWKCTAAEIQAALTNLGTCPAWQDSAASVHVSLISEGQQQTLEQSVSALAAVGSKKVQLSLQVQGLQVAGELVEHLGATLGGRLTHLELSTCTILHDLWPATWRHLP